MTSAEKRQRIDELLSGIRLTHEDVKVIKNLVRSLGEASIGVTSYQCGPSGGLPEQRRDKALKQGRALLKRLKGKA